MKDVSAGDVGTGTNGATMSTVKVRISEPEVFPALSRAITRQWYPRSARSPEIWNWFGSIPGSSRTKDCAKAAPEFTTCSR